MSTLNKNGQLLATDGWTDNDTRLNATNMNKMGSWIKDNQEDIKLINKALNLLSTALNGSWKYTDDRNQTSLDDKGSLSFGSTQGGVNLGNTTLTVKRIYLGDNSESRNEYSDPADAVNYYTLKNQVMSIGQKLGWKYANTTQIDLEEDTGLRYSYNDNKGTLTLENCKIEIQFEGEEENRTISSISVPKLLSTTSQTAEGYKIDDKELITWEFAEEVIYELDSRITGDESDTWEDLTLHGLDKYITKVKDELVGDTEDSADKVTLYGLRNYTSSEVSRITGTDGSDDLSLSSLNETDIKIKSDVTSINNALNFFAKDPLVSDPEVDVYVPYTSVEVGTKIQSLTLKETKRGTGSYTYGCVQTDDDGNLILEDDGSYAYIYETGKTGVEFSKPEYTLTIDGQQYSPSINTNELVGVQFTDLDAIITDNSNISIRCSNGHSAGHIPVDSVGRPKAELRITEGTVYSTVQIYPYRQVFYGFKYSKNSFKDIQEITSDDIRNLGNASASFPSQLKVPAGTKQVFFAVKAGTKSNLTIKDYNAQNAPVACKKIIVSVEGANNYTAVDYDLWYVNLDGAFAKEGDLRLTWS